MRRILVLLFASACCAPAAAQQEIHLWHAMGGALGETLNALVQRFNESQKEVRVVAEHKGSAEDTMIAALSAPRAAGAPHLVQATDIGTAQMMASKSAVRPVWQVFADGGEKIDPHAFLPAVASYFSDNAGKLVALPFNIATPILFYNKDAFRKAKLDPERPPRTWYEMPKAMGELAGAGYECVYTTVWPSWVQIENMSTWHNQDFATRENGLAGLDAKLIFNTHLMVRHVSMLSSWARSGYFTYSGRRIQGERRFERGECAMITASSASYAQLRSEAKFDFGAAQLPYYDDIKGAPHHSLISGGGLWAMAGKSPAETARHGALPRLAGAARDPGRLASAHRLRAGHARGLRADCASGFLQDQSGPRDRDQAAAAQPADARVARHPAGRLRGDPRHHRGRTGSGLGGEGGAQARARPGRRARRRAVAQVRAREPGRGGTRGAAALAARPAACRKPAAKAK